MDFDLSVGAGIAAALGAGFITERHAKTLLHDLGIESGILSSVLSIGAGAVVGGVVGNVVESIFDDFF